MNRKLTRESKNLAKQTILSNVLKFIIIILISCFPLLLCNLSLATLLPVVDVTNFTIEQFIDAYKVELLSQFGSFALTLLFFPITIAANKMFLDISWKQETSYKELFENYSSISKVLSSISLYISVMFKTFIRSIPCILLWILFAFAFGVLSTLGFIWLGIVVLVAGFIFVAYYSMGRTMIVVFFEQICCFNFENPDFSRRETYRELKAIYKKRTFELARLQLSFVPFAIIAVLVSSFTFFIPLFLFNAYYIIATTNYAIKYNTQFLPNNINSQEDYYGQ